VEPVGAAAVYHLHVALQVAEVGGEHGGGYHSATVGHDGES
jgi:hypothetical protein